MCVCESAYEAINYIHVILNLHIQLNKFVAFTNATKLFMHGRVLCNEACHDRNQSNNFSAVKVISFTERVVLTVLYE